MRTSTIGLIFAALVGVAAVIGWAISLWITAGDAEVVQVQGPVITSDFELVDQAAEPFGTRI